MAAARYRADYYLFRNFLVGMGPFQDRTAVSQEALKLVFGVNRPFQVNLEEQWLTARTALIRGGCPHLINGRNDWQVVIWVDPDTSLWWALERRSLVDRDWAIHEAASSPRFRDVIQTAADIPDPRGVLDMAEMIIRVYCGARGFPAHWDGEVQRTLRLIDEDPGSVDVRSLARRLGRPVETLNADFRRVLGLSLEDYLHRRKWIGYIGYRQSGLDRNEALRLSGLPGWEGLRERFEARYGLDLEILENSLPFVRVYEGIDDRPLLYLN
jgi:hypothetical protein